SYINDLYHLIWFYFFFFQAEDGIRDRNVTGVQTCALPIYIFINYAKNISIYMNHSKEIVNMIKEPTIKVGFSPSYSYSFIVEVLKTIKLAGNVDIEVIEGHDSVSLNEMALAGEVDLIFTREALPASHDIISEYLFDNPLVVVIPKG